MRKLWKPGWCSIPGFLFFCALGFVARIAATGPFFCSRRIAPLPELRPSLVGKTGGRELFFVFGESLRSRNCAPSLAGKTGGAGAVFCSRRIAPLRSCARRLSGNRGVRELFFCFRRIGPVPKHRPADGRSAGLRRNCPNSPQWFALRAESIRKTLSDCLETRCGEGVCYEIVKYI